MQSSHYDFENRSPRALFAKKWESHNTKEYSLLQKIGVPAPKMGVQNCKLSVSESSGMYHTGSSKHCFYMLHKDAYKVHLTSGLLAFQITVAIIFV